MTDSWTTGYLAALAGTADTLPFLPSPRRFAGQTVRQRIRLRRGGEPAGEIVGGLRALAGRAGEHGVQPVLGTITPFGGSSLEAFLADGNEDVRRAVNDAITAQTDWPFVDFAAALADPDDSGRLASALDSGDGVHPGDYGARALAAAVDLAVFK